MQKKFHVYKSSAGSGKTYTLVKEYLKIVLLQPGAVRHILAITFTNAAAAEMKERIIEALGQLASLGRDPGNKKARSLFDQITGEWKAAGIDAPAREQVIDNARTVISYILHDYSDFSVSTIDSFVHRVIRTFSFDLHIPFNFTVELDTEALLNQAVDLLINRVGKDKALTELLVSYIINQADDDQDIRVEQKIAGLAKTLTEEDSIIHIRKLKDIGLEKFQQVAGRLRKSVHIFEQGIRTEAEAAINLIREKNLPPEAFYRGKQGIFAYFHHLAAGKIREKAIPGIYAASTVEEDKWVSGKCTEGQQAGIMEIRPLLIRHYNNIQDTVREGFVQYLCELTVLRTIFPLALLNEVEKMMEEIKSEQVMLHISDFNKRIADEVSKQPVPFIYERLGERYHHYMIDEFQDTSLLQWQNLLPLVENALSEGYMSLVVGDGKQAIYRFRNGDVEQFAKLPHLTEGIRAVAKPEWEVVLLNNYLERSLDTNWRSSKAVVDFNNRFFRFASQTLNESLQSIYQDVKQKHLLKKATGYVNIRFIDGADNQSRTENTLEAIMHVINDCQQAGHPLRDITILCRANDEASLVARELLAQQIPVISAESLLLSQSDEVNFFLAIIKLLANPHDKIAAVEMLEFLHKYGHITQPSSLHETLKASGLYAPSGKKAPREAPQAFGPNVLFRQKAPPAFLHTPLERLMQRNGLGFSFRDFAHLNIYDTCESILRHFFAGQSPPSPFVAFFMDAAYDFSEKHTLSYADFISWWEENGHKYSIVVPEGVEAVQVMTVHKSKGLQFPVVIHPFAKQKADKPTKPGLWTEGEKAGVPDLPVIYLQMSRTSLSGTPFEQDFEREQQKTFLDMLNATYVAFTRPSQKLFILSKKEPKEYKTENVQGLLHHFLKNEGLWHDGKDNYHFGDFGPPDEKKGPLPASGSPLRRLMSSPWSKALRMRSHQAERKLLFDSKDPLERGNLLHRAMENIRHTGDIDPVLEQMHDNGEIDTEKMAEWSGKIRHMLSDAQIAPYFSEDAQIKTEAGLFDQDGAFYRPDRVVFLKDECVIIDYKTGKRYRKHEDQMNTYAGILKKMGYPTVKKVLLYLDEGIVRGCSVNKKHTKGTRRLKD